MSASGPACRGLVSEPIMRYRMVVVAGPHHHLAGADFVPFSSLAGQDWLVGAAGADPSSDAGRFLRRTGAPESRLRVFASEAAAWAAAADGHGLALAASHLVTSELERRSLVVLPVAGTPVDLFWYVSTISADRRSPAATRLRRFLATPDAMHLLLRADGSVPAARFRPPVYVTLWS